jgi:hypothetical protein
MLVEEGVRKDILLPPGRATKLEEINAMHYLTVLNHPLNQNKSACPA